jgi:hypothetical protein
MDSHMQTNDSADYLFQYRIHQNKNRLTRATAHMDCLDLARETFSHPPNILGEYSVKVLVNIESL